MGGMSVCVCVWRMWATNAKSCRHAGKHTHTHTTHTTTTCSHALHRRANLDCDFWTDPLDILLGRKPCSAHCLDFDPLWYSVSDGGVRVVQREWRHELSVGWLVGWLVGLVWFGWLSGWQSGLGGGIQLVTVLENIAICCRYTHTHTHALSHAQGYMLGSAMMQFSISIHIELPTTPTTPPPATDGSTTGSNSSSSSATSGGGVSRRRSFTSGDGVADELLVLSPSVPLAVAQSRLVSAKLLGDLATYTQLPAIRCASVCVRVCARVCVCVCV